MGRYGATRCSKAGASPVFARARSSSSFSMRVSDTSSLVEGGHLFDLPGGMGPDIVAMHFQRLDGGEEILAQRVEDLQAQFDVRFALVDQPHRPVRRVLPLRVVAKPAGAPRA